MKIIVLLKSARTSPGSDETLEGLSPGDRAALGTAIALATEQDETIAITAGPVNGEGALGEALAEGIGRAIRITDPLIRDADQRTLATVLAGGLRKVGFDLILTGQRSADWASGGTAPAVAHLLHLPHVTSVVRVEKADADLLVSHRRERCDIDLLVKPPAVLALLAGPRLERGRAENTDAPDRCAIEQLSLAEMTLPFRKPLVATGREVLLVGYPRAAMLEDVESLATLLEPRR